MRKWQTGERGTTEYRIWAGLRDRCNRPGNKRYRDYGGRGIKVCARWDNYGKFLKDMGRRPSKLHSLERVNNDGDYEPSNCRWATRAEQYGNMRSNVNLTFNGKTMHISAWARELGIHERTIGRRLSRGWPLDAALTTPGDRSSGKRMRDALTKAGRITPFAPEGALSDDDPDRDNPLQPVGE